MHLFELRPNSSLTPRAAILFYLSIMAVLLSIGTGFAALGLWLILPFAGLELVMLGAALAVSVSRSQAREFIRVEGPLVRVSKVHPGRRSELDLARAWTRVELEPAPVRHWPARLRLRSQGRTVEVGSFLTDPEKRALEARLRQVIAADRLDGVPATEPTTGRQ